MPSRPLVSFTPDCLSMLFKVPNGKSWRMRHRALPLLAACEMEMAASLPDNEAVVTQRRDLSLAAIERATHQSREYTLYITSSVSGWPERQRDLPASAFGRHVAPGHGRARCAGWWRRRRRGGRGSSRGGPGAGGGFEGGGLGGDQHLLLLGGELTMPRRHRGRGVRPLAYPFGESRTLWPRGLTPSPHWRPAFTRGGGSASLRRPGGVHCGSIDFPSLEGLP